MSGVLATVGGTMLQLLCMLLAYHIDLTTGIASRDRW